MWSGGFGSSYGDARGGGPMKREDYGWRDAGPYGGKTFQACFVVFLITAFVP